MQTTRKRRLSSGVEIDSDGTAHARVWAPARKAVEIVLDSNRARTWRLAPEGHGFFGGEIAGLKGGDRYWIRLDGLALRPDPVSRFQPDGPHGPSEVVDPTIFSWTDSAWRGLKPDGHVIYEMHVGTFTPEGTWRAAAELLPSLVDLGITVIEMMPVADFAGRFGWGYDGVNLYAPTRLYGAPDDLRFFIDRAHALKLGVILDVVYNHLGPDGNYLNDFAPEYFTNRYKNDWGQAINFEGPAPARDFFVENAAYWIEEFHFDGLRLDATQDMHDTSAEHVIASITRAAREAAGRRGIFIVAENEPQETRLVRSVADDGFGGDALWNDDYHHTAVVALTGKREAYYMDYTGSPQELISCAKYGYLYQGQWYSWQKQRRGTPGLDLPPRVFVAYLENHDQVANSATGRRLHHLSSPARLRTLTALTLLGPATPMLFQGQEFASSAPFLYFADHKPELSASISSGRREFLLQFPSVADPSVQEMLPEPDETAFKASILNHAERDQHREWYALHRDLIQLRRTDPVIQRMGMTRPDGAVLSANAFLLRYFGGADGDRMLVVNLGCDMTVAPAPEPLLAPPPGTHWDLVWSSEAPRYGGQGTAPVNTHSEIRVPGESAVLFQSVPGPVQERTPRAKSERPGEAEGSDRP